MIDELFDALERNKGSKRDHHGHRRHLEHENYSEDHDGYHIKNKKHHSEDFDFGHLRFKDLLHNKKIIMALLIVIPILLLVLLGIIIVAFPAIKNIWDNISNKGLNGIIEAAVPFLKQFWEGNKG